MDTSVHDHFKYDVSSRQNCVEHFIATNIRSLPVQTRDEIFSRDKVNYQCLCKTFREVVSLFIRDLISQTKYVYMNNYIKYPLLMCNTVTIERVSNNVEIYTSLVPTLLRWNIP